MTHSHAPAWECIPPFLRVRCLIFKGVLVLSIAGLAPLARHSFATAQKSTQKRPPHQLRPVKSTGYPLSPHHRHAAKKLAHVKKHACSNSFHGKPMTMAQPQWLAEVEVKSKTEKQKPRKTKKRLKKSSSSPFYLRFYSVGLETPVNLKMSLLKGLFIGRRT